MADCSIRWFNLETDRRQVVHLAVGPWRVACGDDVKNAYPTPKGATCQHCLLQAVADARVA